MGESPSLILNSLAIGVSTLALFSTMSVLFPRLLQSSQRAAAQMPGRSLLVGLVNLLFLTVLGLAFNALGNGLGARIIQLLALPPALAIVLGLAFGLAGMSALVGARLAPERSQPTQTILGGAALILGCLAPFIGWFGLFPYVALRGLGGVVIGLFSRAPAEDSPA